MDDAETNPSTPGAVPVPPAPRVERAQRLAAALRDNLKRRKIARMATKPARPRN